MKKIIVIGDIHGRTNWKNIPLEGATEVVFMGDYFDPYDGSYIPSGMIKNLQEILEVPGAIRLLGNHDMHYLDSDFPQGSRYDYWFSEDYKKILEDNLDKFQRTWQIEDILFSHAGLTEGLWRKDLRSPEISPKYISLYLNELTGKDYKALCQCGPGRGGLDLRPGIFWADIEEVDLDPKTGITQVIGHTRIKEISKSPDHDLWFVDSLEYGNYLEITIGDDGTKEFRAKKIGKD